MATAIGSVRKLPISTVTTGVIAVVLLVCAITYLDRPVHQTSDAGGASAEAKAYLPNLELSDVKMQATENFMNQQVVEVEGKITNHGNRSLAVIDVYCLFSDVNSKEIHRERVPVVHELAPSETRAFRLPFDSLPASWNRALPHLIIAKIEFRD